MIITQDLWLSTALDTVRAYQQALRKSFLLRMSEKQKEMKVIGGVTSSTTLKCNHTNRRHLISTPCRVSSVSVHWRIQFSDCFEGFACNPFLFLAFVNTTQAQNLSVARLKTKADGFCHQGCAVVEVPANDFLIPFYLRSYQILFFYFFFVSETIVENVSLLLLLFFYHLPVCM